LIHQKVIDKFFIVFIISSVFCVSSTIGKAFTQANSLNKAHFHSMTGSHASHHIFHKPSTADQSEITATVFDLRVYLYAFSLFFAISLHGSATHGVYARDRSCFVSSFILLSQSIFHCSFSCSFKLSLK
jgi:hypothetical protein